MITGLKSQGSCRALHFMPYYASWLHHLHHCYCPCEIVVYRLPNPKIRVGLSSDLILSSRLVALFPCTKHLCNSDCGTQRCRITTDIAKSSVADHDEYFGSSNHGVTTNYGSADVQRSCCWCAGSTGETTSSNHVANTNMVSYHICTSCPSTTTQC